jgi:teichuronic acid biosynthesis glycosyltransferase TuaC
VERAGDREILSQARGPDADLVTEPLRVLILSTRYPDEERLYLGNFVERQMRELAARPGVELEVVAPRGRPLRPLRALSGRAGLEALPREALWRGLRVHRPVYPVLPGLAALTPRLMARRLLPLLRAARARFPFDLISAEFAWPEGPAAVRLGRALGVPVSIKARGADFERWRTGRRARRELLQAGRAAAGLLAVSGSVRASMIEAGLPPDRIRLHYPAVDTDRFRPLDPAAAKAALRLAGPVLLTIGNLRAEKQQHLAIEALARLPGATLVMVGGGPRAADLRRLADSLGVADRVRFVGAVPHELLPNFYAAADLLIHPSAVEGFANVRLEALACGTPVVSTAAGEAERLIRSPSSGRIVAADAGEIAAAAAVLLADPPHPCDVREAALEFSWARATDALEDWFRALAGGTLPPVTDFRG